MRAGLHYIAVNLLASSLFLIGVAMLYGVTGTLNMADIAQKMPQVPAGDRGLLHAGAAILGSRVPRQGGDVAAQLLAGAGLRGGERAGRGAVRHADEGRRLRGAAPVDAAASAEAGAVGAFGADALVVRRTGDAGVRRRRHAGFAAAAPHRRHSR